ncbi:MAG: hypothetical protein CMM49_08545 [Rhodospirillaceae bacterium]|nr:hypothetical protein [Rhodospirillaceae bacterium]|tara:strand:+ start:765 stop:1436 length:672 start_codon:yes stop_codon:yes gene_type:complete
MYVLNMDGPKEIPDDNPEYLMFLLHGYGANGNDLFSLTPYLNKLFPQIAFLAPHAPFECSLSQNGRQWFSIDQLNSDYNFKKDSTIYSEIEQSSKILENFIYLQKENYSIGNKKIILVGFSQGAMMALHLGLKLESEIACIVGFSGALISFDNSENTNKSFPSVFLAHGELDNVVNCNETMKAYNQLSKITHNIEKYIEKDLYHSISQEGLTKAIDFIKNVIK